MKRYLLMVWYWLVNYTSRKPVTNTDMQNSPVVSLTSYDPRIGRVFATIESIAAGGQRPGRLILWLDDSFKTKPIPRSLQRLQARGLEILFCSDDGPHKKYRPYILSQAQHNLPLITADDDVLYPHDWLTQLWSAHRENPETVCCYRARVIRFDSLKSNDEQNLGQPIFLNTQVAPYRSWPPCASDQASLEHFSIGVSGVLYPPSLLLQLKKIAGDDLFRELTPRADDIWLNFWGSYWGYKKKQLTPVAQEFTQIPFSSRSALHRHNVVQGENDAQIQAMVSHLKNLSSLQGAAAE